MEGNYPMARVCAVLGAPRSTIYHRRARGDQLGCRPGPKTAISDDELVAKIRQVLVRGIARCGPGSAANIRSG